jgi:DUF971 family protein
VRAFRYYRQDLGHPLDARRIANATPGRRARLIDQVRDTGVASSRDDITIEYMHLVGHHALRILWSEGHATGPSTETLLRFLCPRPRCRAQQPAAPG